MVRAIPRGLGRAVWPLMVVTLVALAVYVSGGRLLLNALPGVQQDIEQLLSQRLSGDIRIGEISGSMDGLHSASGFDRLFNSRRRKRASRFSSQRPACG